MAVFRVERNTGYTVMSNHHLRNKELSLKAKGLLSQMLSLPEDWDYTLSGLSYINRESIDAIRTAVWELEKAGYITRRQGRDEKGKMTAIEYTIYEQPQPPELDCPVLENPTADNPILENPTTDNPTSENPMQLNKDISRTNLPKKEKSNTDLSITHSIPIHSLNPLPYGEDEAAQPPERKRAERNDAYRVYEEIIKDNIEYDILLQDMKFDHDRLNEIVDIILETVCTSRKKIRIAGDDYPAELVKSKFMKLSSEHIRFVLDCIESTHPGYDEYRYDLANIGHNPHELASYLTAKYQSYTRAEVQSELQRIFNQQYRLTLTEEVEIRYREEERTDTWTDEDGNEHTDTYTVQVPYEYYILNVKLTNTPLSTIAENNLTPEQLEMYRVYLQTSGNKPLIFGGGSPDTSASEDLSGVDFVNGTRPGNTAIVDLAKQQVGNVGGYPYWSWYGFNSRVEWCACFVSWCYGQMGLSEPRFAACQSQGIPWFTSHGQWGARGYENIAPGDAIFFDWDLDGSADHVGLVIGRDESRVYTVEGNSGDACKIKSYPLDYACIKGYGLMNWN